VPFFLDENGVNIRASVYAYSENAPALAAAASLHDSSEIHLPQLKQRITLIVTGANEKTQ
jgi:hypothetical protein